MAPDMRKSFGNRAANIATMGVVALGLTFAPMAAQAQDANATTSQAGHNITLAAATTPQAGSIPEADFQNVNLGQEEGREERIQTMKDASQFVIQNPGSMAVTIWPGEDARRRNATNEKLETGFESMIGGEPHYKNAEAFSARNNEETTEVRFFYRTLDKDNGEPLVMILGPFNLSQGIEEIPHAVDEAEKAYNARELFAGIQFDQLNR